jgi:hypothetical protein
LGGRAPRSFPSERFSYSRVELPGDVVELFMRSEAGPVRVGKYSVELKVSARKELERLPAKLIERIFPKLEGAGFGASSHGVQEVEGWAAGLTDFESGIIGWFTRSIMRSW